MSSSFLQTYRHTLRCRRLLGICPFRLDAHNERVSLHSPTTAATCVHIVAQLVLYVLLAHFAHDELDVSTTSMITVLIDHFAMGLLYVCAIVAALMGRQRHCALINRVQSASRAAFADETKLFQHRARQFVNVTLCAMFFGAPFSNLFVFKETVEDDYVMPLRLAMFYILFCLITANQLAFMEHIMDTAGAVTVTMRRCLAQRHASADGRFDERQFIDLWALKDEVLRCFSVQLLLNTVNDLIVTTIMLFYVISSCAFDDECNDPFSAYYFGVYVMPVVVKDVWLVCELRRMEQCVEEFRRILIGMPQPNHGVRLQSVN